MTTGMARRTTTSAWSTPSSVAHYDAAHEYDAAARLMIRSAEPHNNLGLLLEEAGMLSDAVDAFEAAHQRDEENSLYLANLSRAVRRGDRGEEVIRLLESLQIPPTTRDGKTGPVLSSFASAQLPTGAHLPPTSATRPAGPNAPGNAS